MALTTVTVTGTYSSPDGTGVAQGQVQFVLSNTVNDAAANKRTPPIPITATIGADGTISQPLIANDDADADPTGTSYTVTERITWVATPAVYIVQIPHDAAGGTVDLADLAHMEAAPAVVAYLTAADASATYGALAGPNTWTGDQDFSGATVVGIAGGSGGSGLPSTVVSKTADYTAAAGDFVQADATTGNVTITLPAAPATGSLVTVKRIDASANTVTVAPAGTGSIDGDPSATIVSQWAGAIFEHVGADAWRITGVLSYDAAVADATTTTKGIIQLAGDLAGTADAPEVPGLAGKLPLAGGTMTGALVLSGDPAAALQAATKQYVDGKAGGGASIPGIFAVAAASGDTTGATDTAAIQAQIDAAYAAGGGIVQLSGASPDAPYFVTQLKIRKGVTLQGVSRSGTVLRAPIGNTTHMIVLYDKTETWGWAVRHLTVDGQNGSGPNFGSTWTGQANSFDGIHIDNHLGTQQFAPYNFGMVGLVEDVLVVQVPGHGLLISDTTSECRFIDVVSLFARDCCWYITGFDLFFDSCTAGQGGSMGFCLNVADVNQFINCKAFWCGARGNFSNLGSANYWIKGQGNMFANCFSQDSYTNSWQLVSAHENRITGSSAGAGTTSSDLHIAGSNNNHIDLAIGHGQNNTPAQHVLNHPVASTGNVITITGDSNCTGTKLTGLSMIGNELTMLQQRASQSVAYAATITPDPYKGARIVVGTLTGALTVADPANAHHGCVLTLTLPQDATGGRAVTFGASYKTTAAIITTASSVTIISFVYDGTNWREIARSTT